MNMLHAIVFVLLVSLLLLALVFIYIRHKQKLKSIHEALASTDLQTLTDIYSEVEKCGSSHSGGHILGRTGITSEKNVNRVVFPDNVPGFPWTGKTLEIKLDGALKLSISDSNEQQSILGGEKFVLIKIPSVEARPGQYVDLYLPNRYINVNPDLLSKLKSLCPQYPEQFLAHLLCPGTHGYEFEPTDQIRIGNGISWVKSRELFYCGICEKKMSLILQMPGNVIDATQFRNEVIYLFGCRDHPHIFKHIVQNA